MDSRVVLAAALLIAMVVGVHSFTTKYDDINMEEILNNDRLLKKYLKCLIDLDDTECTAEGKELKASLPQALETCCAECTEKQKEKTRITIEFLQKNKPEEYQKLLDVYDKDKKYREKYEKECNHALDS